MRSERENGSREEAKVHTRNFHQEVKERAMEGLVTKQSISSFYPFCMRFTLTELTVLLSMIEYDSFLERSHF